MIYDPFPTDWRVLQQQVCKILQQCGITAETERVIRTVRGTVTVDVFGIDEQSVDRITYIVECKNWQHPVSQTVSHAFLSVMQGSEANIGYIISKKGFQAGAYEHLRYTNIKAMTFAQFQEHYLKSWLERYFFPVIKKAAEDLQDYTEPINTFRNRKERNLSEANQQRFQEVWEDSHRYGEVLLGLDARYIAAFPSLFPQSLDLTAIKDTLKSAGPDFAFTAETYTDLLAQLLSALLTITQRFDEIFGGNIFKPRRD